MSSVKSLVPLTARVRAQRAYLYAKWLSSGQPSPAPQAVKLGVFARYGYEGGTWVESGTYLGDTTRILARHAERVFTIEPSSELAARARQGLADLSNVEVLEGLSEDVLPSLLHGLNGTISFWLDGHASGGLTHSGSKVTPIREEFATISEHIGQFDRVAVLVDDFRGFGGRHDVDGAYPSRASLVAWADSHNMNWTVEHDIFVSWR